MVSLERPLERILVVRPDRIGDVILSTPVLIQLRRKFPQAKIVFWVQEMVAPLLRGLSFIDEVWTYHSDESLFRLVSQLKKISFDAAVVLQSQPKLSWAILLAQIPIRVGPLSKPHSFLVFNRGLRQSRSKVQMHEAEYNLELLKPLGVSEVPRTSTEIFLDPQVRGQALQWLKKQGWNEKSLIAVHPGMGGSASNWPQSSYLELVQKLLAEGHSVLVTGGPEEEALLAPFRRSGAWVYGGTEAQTVEFLAGLFSHASLVVAPSTGPLHIAVALKKTVVSFYPSIRVQSPKRWGPYVEEGQKAHVFCDSSSQVSEGMRSACSVGANMENLKVDEVFHKIQEIHSERSH